VKEAWSNGVPLVVDMACLIHDNWVSCGNWRDVYLPSAGSDTYRETSVRADPAYDVDSDRWYT
jgi:hypothetical protein